MKSSCCPEQLEPPEAPSIDDASDDEQEPSADEFDEFAEGIEEELQDTTVLDDEAATELDVGIELAALPDEADELGAELVVDMTALLSDSGVELESDTTPELGPVDLDVAAGLAELPDDWSGDAEEGTEEPVSGLVNDELPVLEADAEGDLELEEVIDLAWAYDDPPPPPAPLAWHPRLWHENETLSALSTRRGSVAAAGVDILWLDCGSDAPMRLAAFGVPLLSLVLTDADTAVFATVTGQLGRRHRMSRAAEPLDAWRKAAGLTESSPATLELYVTERAENDVVLVAHCSSRQLLRSTDGGKSWYALELTANIQALAVQGSVIYALQVVPVPCLYYSRDAGQSFQACPLDRTAADIALGDRPSLTVCENVVAISDGARGLAISADAGTSFVRIPGCANATAITAWRMADTVCVAAALYRDADQVSDIALIEVKSLSAHCIGTVTEDDKAHPPDENGEVIERARVERLAWDAPNRRLWMAGSFGLLSYEPAD